MGQRNYFFSHDQPPLLIFSFSVFQHLTVSVLTPGKLPANFLVLFPNHLPFRIFASHSSMLRKIVTDLNRLEPALAQPQCDKHCINSPIFKRMSADSNEEIYKEILDDHANSQTSISTAQLKTPSFNFHSPSELLSQRVHREF
ncbi:hypothetical protein E1B28_009641 [Marasmius oreades]|uniref:Uncharacterized protein n=1 Tax=Marasmius oreades TaxID=181124 RepID=A0A9P7RW66_9AGAR|nr:uncharacterized protein E1B28_009641 [Marasmius oreades]KAG7090532.1 hypothetical protein E1B28_009641 [Marasmius oreades]